MQWGNSLAVRVPAAVARSARFAVGQPVEVTVEADGVVVKPVGEPKLSLAQKLALFGPVKQVGALDGPAFAGPVAAVRGRAILVEPKFAANHVVFSAFHAENPAHNLRMKSGENRYIWQADDWPDWRYDLVKLAGPVAEVSRAQGLLMGRMPMSESP
jgi:antitoxin MazE